MLKLRTLTTLLLLLLAPGCSSDEKEPETAAVPPAGFVFTTIEEVQLNLTVTQASSPIGFVAVQVTGPMSAPTGGQELEDVISSDLFFVGSTDASGLLTAEFTVPPEFTELDLVIHRPGTTGPYTDEALRTIWGDFAPSARITVTRQDVITETIDLL